MGALRIVTLAAVVLCAAAQEADYPAQFNADDARLLSELGSGSPPSPGNPPPPPTPMSPPGAPGAAVFTEYSTVATMIADGNIVDFTTTVRASIAQKFATAANVPSSNVTLTISEGSVVISAKVIVASATAAQVATNTLTDDLSSPELASAFVSTPALTVTVVSAPVVVPVTETVVTYPPPPPPPPPPAPTNDDDGLDGGAIAAIVIGSLVIAAMFAAGAVVAVKGMGDSSSSKDGSAGVMFTSVGANQQENV